MRLAEPLTAPVSRAVLSEDITHPTFLINAFSKGFLILFLILIPFPKKVKDFLKKSQELLYAIDSRHDAAAYLFPAHIQRYSQLPIKVLLGQMPVFGIHRGDFPPRLNPLLLAQVYGL